MDELLYRLCSFLKKAVAFHDEHQIIQNHSCTLKVGRFELRVGSESDVGLGSV